METVPSQEFALREKMAAFYAGHQAWLQGWLRSRLGCPQDAEDLTQDTFVRVIGSALHPDRLDAPRSYLLTIARGLTIDLFRRRDLEREYLAAVAHLAEDCLPSEEERAQMLDLLVQLDTMLDGLGKGVKDVLILAQFDGLSYPQIAERLGISLRTVNYRMARAMEHCCLFRIEHGLPLP